MVKIRLQRVGTKKRPFYRVVAIDERKRRDGAVIDYVGRYQPIVDGEQFTVDEDKVLSLLNQGAQPTATVLKQLKLKGIWDKFRAAKK